MRRGAIHSTARVRAIDDHCVLPPTVAQHAVVLHNRRTSYWAQQRRGGLHMRRLS